MTKTEILELNIRDQNELISDLDLACAEMEDLLVKARNVIFFHKQEEAWLQEYNKWNDALEKINE